MSADGGFGETAGLDEGGRSEQARQLVGQATECLSGLGGTLTEFAQTRPIATAVAGAVLVGGLIGLWFARRPGRTPALGRVLEKPAEQAGRQAGRMAGLGRRANRLAAYSELVPLAIKLFENPIVRGFVMSAVARRVARRSK